ncbi:MAG: ADOP family duplicated permease [Gemmatimonadota bacterium]
MPDRPPPAEPPGWADALLEASLPTDVKGATILGDVYEEFHERAERDGVAVARRWFSRSALALGARYAWRRGLHAALHREGRGGEVMASIWADVKFGFRMLARTPGLSAVAIVTIAFGVGLTTHMYSTVYGAVIRGLPVPEQHEIVSIHQVNQERNIRQGSFPFADYAELGRQDSGLESVAAYYQGTVNLAGDEAPPERFQGAFVSWNTFDVVGVAPVLGRTFGPGEDGPDVEPRLVLSYHVWQNRFDGDREVIGRIVRANGAATEIIGVMPEGFQFPFMEDMWLPLPFEEETGPRRTNFVDVFGRLPDGGTVESARAAMAPVAQSLADAYPEDNAGTRFDAIPFTERFMPPQITAVLYLMLAATFGVLLIACANVANLLLARASLRSREVAIRTAMGAGRGRVIRQMLAEALVLALFGGMLGVAIAWVGVTTFGAAIVSIEKPFWIDMGLEPRGLIFATAVTLVATLAAGVYPALRASGLGMGSILKDEGRGSSSLRLGRFSSMLVVGEVAVSCALLVTAGFMIKSVANLRTLDLGFEPESVLVGRVGLFETDYPTMEERSLFFEELQSRIAALPGVETASLANNLPGLGGGSWPITVEGDTYDTPRDHPISNGNVVTAGFFDAAGIPILRGRDIGDVEAWDGSDPVAVVSESFATTVFGERDPIGLRVKIGTTQSDNPWMRVVGIVPDTYVGGGVGGIGDDLINPEQIYAAAGPYDLRFMSAVVRTSGPPAALAPDFRRIVSEMDPNLPVYQLSPLDEAIDQATWAFGLFGSLFTIFGFSALFLAAVGLYGVMSFSVTQRRQEMGVRMALGAGPDRILRLVLTRGVGQLAIGMVIGLGLGVGLSIPLRAVTFGVETADPVVYGSITFTLALTGLIASFVPARAATRADPVQAMRP